MSSGQFINFCIQHFCIQVFLFNVGMYNTPNSAQFFKLDTRMFDPQINGSAPPVFPAPAHTTPHIPPVTLSPSVILLLSAPHRPSPFAVRLLSIHSKKKYYSAPPPLWLDVLFQLTRGWTHKSGKGRLSELQSWAPHISYSLGDLLRALHRICLSSRLARTHIFTPSLMSLCCLLHLLRLPYSSSSSLLHLS